MNSCLSFKNPTKVVYFFSFIVVKLSFVTSTNVHVFAGETWALPADDHYVTRNAGHTTVPAQYGRHAVV